MALLRRLVPLPLRLRLRRLRRAPDFDETRWVLDSLGGYVVPKLLVDVGAHYGDTALPYLAAGWSAVLLEPDSRNYAVLEKRMRGRQSVHLVGRAAHERPGLELPWYSSPESSGISGFSPFHESHERATTVVTTTVRDVLESLDLDRVGMLKVDTEGHDLFVLRGVDWERAAPAVVICEFEDGKTLSLGYSWRDLAEYLMERGYELLVSEWYPIVRYGRRHRWRGLKRYPCAFDSTDAWGNLIAYQPYLGDVARSAQACRSRDS